MFSIDHNNCKFLLYDFSFIDKELLYLFMANLFHSFILFMKICDHDQIPKNLLSYVKDLFTLSQYLEQTIHLEEL